MIEFLEILIGNLKIAGLLVCAAVAVFAPIVLIVSYTDAFPFGVPLLVVSIAVSLALVVSVLEWLTR